jgi:hypothetical protein
VGVAGTPGAVATAGGAPRSVAAKGGEKHVPFARAASEQQIAPGPHTPFATGTQSVAPQNCTQHWPPDDA